MIPLLNFYLVSNYLFNYFGNSMTYGILVISDSNAIPLLISYTFLSLFKKVTWLKNLKYFISDKKV